MTLVGLDDTDSRTRGMCSTYLASLVAEAVADAGGTVTRRLLVRLNPAVEHKTRGNAALAIHTDLDAGRATDVAADLIEEYAVVDDPHTSPGLVVADCTPESVPGGVADFSRGAVRGFRSLDDALSLAADAGFETRGWGAETDEGRPGRGRIGALAAVGAWAAFDEWTYERIDYRAFDRCGTPREVDRDSVFAAADAAYPAAWDTVDRGTGEAVCVPNAPGPILYGIRGDDADAVARVADGIESEPVERSGLFLTNQGADAHLRDGTLGDLRAGRSYRVTAEVVDPPETRRGGHVFLALGDGDDGGERLDCVAFAPTGRFRDRVRALRAGDRVTACGEVGTPDGGTRSDGGSDPGALKLEKFAVRSLVRTEPAVPACPDCGRSMESAGRGQGYRCRDCGTSADGKVDRRIERDLEPGWYEVPPSARRHVAKPLVRGGFDAPTHPER